MIRRSKIFSAQSLIIGLLLIIIISLKYVTEKCDSTKNLVDLETILRVKNKENHDLSQQLRQFQLEKVQKEQSKKPNPEHKLCVIVPFRERFDELMQFTPFLTKFLVKQLGDKNAFEILIINQADMLRFNRGSLINIGYQKSLEKGCDYLVMHDVDLLPNNENINYQYPSDPKTKFTSVLHLAYPHHKYHYDKYIGGVLLMTNEVFEKLNGLSNNYYGWGREDDELYSRLKVPV